MNKLHKSKLTRNTLEVKVKELGTKLSSKQIEALRALIEDEINEIYRQIKDSNDQVWYAISQVRKK
jgi:hypothetical protein